MSGGKGNDILYGGTGNDTFIYKSGDGNDTIYNYTAEDVIRLAANTSISSAGISGNNCIFKIGNGRITLIDAADKSIHVVKANGDDTWYSEQKSAPLVLSKSNKKVTLTDGFIDDSFSVTNYGGFSKTLAAKIATIDASAVNHALSITGNKNANYVTGSTQDDEIDGGAGADKIYGNAGNDTLYGNTGNDLLDGGNGNDSLSGGKGNDKLYGSDGNDSLWGGAGSDTLWGGVGNDTFIYKKGDETIIIADYENGVDSIIALDVRSVELKTVSKTGNATFNVGNGQIVVNIPANKHVEILDGSGNRLFGRTLG
ncbi:MAG: hypothetical protein SR1Q7_11640 [Quinella sp. 1Q7]|nr:hypothetical protein [Quinella sp. 1Q7]